MVLPVCRVVSIGLLLWVLWTPWLAHASTDVPPAPVQLAHHHFAYLDSSGILSFHQALNQSEHWQRIAGLSVNSGYSTNPLWLRFDVDVQTGEPHDALFEIASPFLDRVEFYLVGWQGDSATLLYQQTAGDHEDFAQRFQQYRYPLFAARFPQSGRYSLLIKVQSTSALMLEANLYPREAFFHHEIRSQVFYGVYSGVIMVLAYFNLMLMIYLRERTFLHNLFFLISLGIYQAALSGFGYSYVWRGNVPINDLVLGLSASSSFFFGGMFAIRFLELKTRAPLYYRLANVLMSGYVVLALMTPFVVEQKLVLLFQVLSLLTALFAFFVMGHQVIHRNPWALYLLLGWSVTIGGYCVFLASMFGWLPYGTTVLYVQAIGLGLGNVLVTTAIAARVRRERRDKDSALRHALELSQEVARLTLEKEQIENTANLHLQREVEQKTLELNQMLESLQKSNRRLEKDSLSDSLTGLHNRRYLDGVFPDIIAQCVRLRSSLGVLVIDADHFKHINDNFGHLAGDEVLRKLATILQKYCRRNLDTLVRFGGEEFVMLLPATDLEGVLKVAESIRHHVQYAQFWFEDQRMSVTVSMGVHVCVPPGHATPENLMHKADEALYLAKRNGRNRIEVATIPFEVAKA